MLQEKKNSTHFLLNVAIIEFFFFSGEKHITEILFHGGIAPFVFLVTCFFCFISNNNIESIKKQDWNKMAFIVIWTCFSTYFLGQGQHNSMWISYVFYALGMLFLLSSCDFIIIKQKLLSFLSFLTLISIVVQLGHDYLDIFPAKGYILENQIRYLSLGVFTTEWGENRLASIYWEPGQYQIVIFYIFVLFSDEWSDFSNIKRSVKKFSIIIIGVIMTFSTTAYLVLMIAILVMILKKGTNGAGVNRNRLISVIVLIIGVLFIISLTQSQAVQEKVEQSENPREMSSYTIRMADNMGCLEVALDAPITGYGPGSDLLEKKLYSAGSMTNSNGWLYASAQLGFPFVFILWFFIWKNLRRHYKANTLLLFMMLIISQSNEAFITFPYLYLYIFNGKEK